MNSVRRAVRAIVVGAVLLASGVVLGTSTEASAETLPSPAPLLQRDSSVVTSDPLPTVQIDNGYVWAQTTVGTTVYAAGKFENARAALAQPGTSLTARNNILAFDITTGNLLSFAPQVNGVIRAVAASPDGTRIYIGGSFTSVNGETRWNLAALDAQTGQLVPGFSSAIGGSGVYALATKGSTVYVGGLFTQANGVARKNLAAFSASNGALQTAWAPTADLQVDAMVMDPLADQLIVGGRFSQVNGNTSLRGLAALDLSSGVANTSWQANATIKNGATSGKAGIFGLAADQSGVYGTGWVYANASVGNLEGTFAVEGGTGGVRWVADCLGDHYGIYSTGSVVYATSHTHACSTVGLYPEQSPRQNHYAEAYTADARGTLPHNPHAGSTYADWYGTPSPSAYAWGPDFTVGTTTGLGQAGLSITGSGDYISIAGEFGSVNNRQFEGIVRFSTNPPGGAKDGPRTTTSAWGAPTATSVAPGRVSVSIKATYDRDDLNLTYELMRSGSTTPVASTTVASSWWNLPQVQLQDTGLTGGSTQSYTVVVKDSDGNAVTSQPVSVTVAAGDAAPYADAVLNDAPSLYYPLGSSSADWAGTNQPQFRTGVSAAGASSGIVGSASGSSDFTGDSTGYVSSSTAVAGSNTFSAEAWFKTTTTRGGKILGFGTAAIGNSGSYDRHVYMLNNGKLLFGVYPGSVKSVTSSESYNDGQWHHVVATLGASGMKLYVDGEQVAADASVTTAQSFNGYWRVGGDSVSGWPNSPTSAYFDGLIDEFAVYPTELSQSSIVNHYTAGSGLVPPTASFTATATDLNLAVDASATAAGGDATIASYTWDFGDESAVQTGVTASHTYATAGDYVVTLTAEDSRGLTSTQQQTVTVLGPNVPPTAEFTTSATGLSVSANGAASSDTDGSIASYDWNWGDGQASTTTTAATTHQYASAGTYTVSLTVTDDRGGVATTTHDVVVTHADPVAVFSSTTDALSVTTDASGSSASDGATLSYAWNWGDGSSGTGATSSHTYADAGTYDVTLTVTDSAGATASVTHEVTVAAASFAVQDDFNRVVAAGWGTADTGGTWTPVYGSGSAASVSNGLGEITLPAGSTRAMALPTVSVQDSTSTLVYSVSSGPQTGSAYVGLIHRQTTAGGYTIQVWHRSNGTVWLLAQSPSGTLSSVAVSGVTWSAGDQFTLQTEVSGSSPTTLKAKVWKSGGTEPSSWQLTTTDSTAALQSAGYSSVRFYVAGSATAPMTASVDRVQIADSQAPAQAPNAAPTAAFTATPNGLSVAADGSASSDSDGSVASYSWNWGDGSAAGTGVTASHDYAAAGTYSVVLTVTDDKGATATSTQSITVQQAQAPNAAPTAAFTATPNGLSVAVDGSASSDSDGSVASYSWNWGDGSAAGTGVTASHDYAAAGTYSVVLTVTDDKGATATSTQSITVQQGQVPASLVKDAFERTTAAGWGTADTGGAWTITGGSASAASVSNGAALFNLAPGSTRVATVTGSSVKDISATLQFSVASGPSNGAQYVGMVTRAVGSSSYAVQAWLRTDGSVWLVAQLNGAAIATAPVSGLTYVAGGTYTLKVEASGDGTTTLNAKIWQSSGAEPQAWQLTKSDSTAALQTSGTFGLRANNASSAAGAAQVQYLDLDVVAL